MYLEEAALACKSIMQNIVALSVTEAELVSYNGNVCTTYVIC